MNRYTYALNNPTSMLDPSGLRECPTSGCEENSGGDDSENDPTYYVDGVEVSASEASWFLSLEGGQQSQVQVQVGLGYAPIGTYGYTFLVGEDLINISLDPFGFFNGQGSSSTSLLVTPTGPAFGPNNSIPSKGSKSSTQKLCEDNLFGASILRGIGSALGVGVPGSDPAGDIASAAKAAAGSPAVQATAGVMAAQLGSALLTRAGAARLGALVSEEFVPGLGWAAGAYIGYSAFRDAMSYYDDNVASCSN
jgi:hypothetical protein